MRLPAKTLETGCSATSNAVTIPKLPASSSNRPVEVWVLVRTCLELSPVGQHQVRGKDVVATNAVLAHQRTNTPAEKKPSHTHRRALTQHGGDSGLCGLDLNRAAQHSAADAGIAFVGSNSDVAEARHVEHDATLTGGVTSIIMASAADSERQMIGPSEAQNGLDVVRVDGTDYERGMLVKLGCIAFAKLFIFRVAGTEDISSKSPCEGCEVGIARLQDRKPGDLLKSWPSPGTGETNKGPAKGKNVDS